MKDRLIKYLSQFVSEHKISLFDRLVNYRTRYITVVLEDIFQPHNASAVLRTCDCFGIQDVHIIENKNKYTINPDVALGAFKWLDLVRYNSSSENTLNAIESLRKRGYRIVATTPGSKDTLLEDFDLKKGRVAFFFGTELEGLSDITINNSDEYLKIPMYGFTESYNISVSAAIILHYLTAKLRKPEISWQLTPEEKQDVLIEWLCATIKKSDLLVREFMKNQQKDSA